MSIDGGCYVIAQSKKRKLENYNRRCEIYRIFAESYNGLDFSPEAKQAMYEWESKGIGDLSFNISSSSLNGFAVGKRYMEVTVIMWKEDIKRGLLFEQELYSCDGKQFPIWWLKEIFKDV